MADLSTGELDFDVDLYFGSDNVTANYIGNQTLAFDNIDLEQLDIDVDDLVESDSGVSEISIVRERPLETHSVDENERAEAELESGLESGNLSAHSDTKVHINEVQTLEKNFPCEHCGERFSSKYYLKKHKNVAHIEQNLFACPDCDKTFGGKRQRTSHIKSVHVKQKPFPCPECGKSFAGRGHLNRHKQTHVRNLQNRSPIDIESELSPSSEVPEAMLYQASFVTSRGSHCMTPVKVFQFLPGSIGQVILEIELNPRTGIAEIESSLSDFAKSFL